MRIRVDRRPAAAAAALAAAVLMTLGMVSGHARARAVPAPGASSAGREAEHPPIALTDRSARALGVQVGDLVDLASLAAGPWRTFRVERVYRPAEYPTEVSSTRVDVRLHVPDAQQLQGGGDAVGRVVVRLRDPARASDVAARLNSLPLGFRAYTSADVAARGSTTFEVVARFNRAISAVTLIASSVFLLVIMTLRGEEMRQQVGLLRLVGVSRRTVAAAVLLIASGIAVAGSLVGVAFGYLLSVSINLYYGRAFDTTLEFSRITPSLLAEGLALSVALGIAAGAATAWRLLRRRPLDQLGR